MTMKPGAMNPGDGSSMPPVLVPREQGKPVDVHRECLGCGYDIWGQDSEGVCPECGREIRLTLAVPISVWDEPEKARRMARGLRRMGMSMIVLLVAFVAGILIEIATRSLRVGVVSSTTPLVYFGVVLSALVVFASGVWTAAQAGPSDRGYGRASAAGLMILAAMGGMMVLDSNNVVRIWVARRESFGVAFGLVFGVQGILLGAWIVGNSWIVAGGRRGAWITRFGVMGVAVFACLVFLLMMVSVGLGPHSSIVAQVGIGVASLALAVVGGLWLVASPVVWLIMARRVKELVVLAPNRATATAGGAAKDEPMTGATTH
ncbi:MAG: hypothetical protein ACREJO_01435 [Phycisphaerales bacterium]